MVKLDAQLYESYMNVLAKRFETETKKQVNRQKATAKAMTLIGMVNNHKATFETVKKNLRSISEGANKSFIPFPRFGEDDEANEKALARFMDDYLTFDVLTDDNAFMDLLDSVGTPGGETAVTAPAPAPAPAPRDERMGQKKEREEMQAEDINTGLTRADRLANNNNEAPRPTATIQGAENTYVEPEVVVEQGLQTVNYNSNSVDDVKEKAVTELEVADAYNTAQDAVQQGSDAVYTTQAGGHTMANPGYIPDPQSSQSAQNLHVVETLEQQQLRLEANEVERRKAQTSMLQSVYGAVGDEVRLAAQQSVENLIRTNMPNMQGSLDEMLPESESAQARTQIEDDMGMPSTPPEYAQYAEQYALDNLPDIVRAEIQRARQSTAEANQAIGEDRVRNQIANNAIPTLRGGERMYDMDGGFARAPAPPAPPAPAPPAPAPPYLGDRAREDGILYDVTALDGSAGASVVGSGGPATVGDASQKSTEELKKEIDALCYIYDTVIPAFASKQLQAEKQIILRSSSRPVVLAFHQQLMNMIRQHFQSTGMRVGVVVSPESLGMGGGMGGVMGGGGAGMEGSPLPGMGGNVRINRHGDNVLAQEGDVRRDSQGVLRGGRNYRSIIQSRIPANLPELKATPSRLPMMRSFSNTPMPGRIRVAKHSISGISLR